MEDVLYDAGIDIVLNGHCHEYERSNAVYVSCVTALLLPLPGCCDWCSGCGSIYAANLCFKNSAPTVACCTAASPAEAVAHVIVSGAILWLELRSGLTTSCFGGCLTHCVLGLKLIANCVCFNHMLMYSALMVECKFLVLVQNFTVTDCGAVHITMGDGGNIEGLCRPFYYYLLLLQTCCFYLSCLYLCEVSAHVLSYCQWVYCHTCL